MPAVWTSQSSRREGADFSATRGTQPKVTELGVGFNLILWRAGQLQGLCPLGIGTPSHTDDIIGSDQEHDSV